MNQTKNSLLFVAVIAATVVAALVVGRGDDPRPKAVAEAAPSSSDPPTALPQGHPLPATDPNALPPGHPPLDQQPADLPAGHPPLGNGANNENAEVKVEMLEGGKTVAQIFAEQEALEGKRIRLRAKVVKAMPNILGKTWLHVQDGTGDAAAGTHDLVVTTQQTPTIGDVVVLEGRVVRNKDLGSGYNYDVLLEEARIEGAPAEAPTEGEHGG